MGVIVAGRAMAEVVIPYLCYPNVPLIRQLGEGNYGSGTSAIGGTEFGETVCEPADASCVTIGGGGGSGTFRSTGSLAT